jgi:hypothetical protein
MRRTAIALGAAALLVSAGLSAQAPNFAGKWTLVPPPDAAAGGGGGGGGRGRGAGGGQFCGMECTITQDAKTLTVSRMAGETEIKATYNLDGTESTNNLTVQGNTIAQKSTAKVAGGAITIVTKTDMGGTVTEATTTLTLKDGSLVVERKGVGREGAPTTTTQTYKKG